MTGVALLAIAGYTWQLSRWRSWPAPSALLPVTCSIVAGLYVAALGGQLSVAAWVVAAGGLVLAVRAAWFAYRDKSLPQPTPGTIASVAALALAYLALRHGAFIGWDEFSHWGVVTSEIARTNALVAPTSSVIFKDYPPGTALFHYFWMLGGPFGEGRVYIAHAALALAAIAVLWAERRWAIVVATGMFAYCAIFVFARGFQTLDVDHLVGLFFGCGLAAYLTSKDPDRVYRLIPVLFVLPLLKRVGLPLSLFAAAIVVSDQLLFFRGKRPSVVVLACLFLAPLAASSTWNWHVDQMKANRTHAVRATADDVLRAFSSTASPHERATIANFREALHATPVGSPAFGTVIQTVSSRAGVNVVLPGFSLLRWGVVGLVMLAALAMLQERRRDVARLLLFFSWIGASGVVYTFGLLVLYLFAFTEYEGVRLASYGRYLGIFMLGVSVTFVAWMLNVTERPGRRRVAGVALLLVVACGAAYAAPPEIARFSRHGAQGMHAERVAVQHSLSLIPELPRDARVYVVWQGTTGAELLIAKYELLPRFTSGPCWSLGDPRFDGDVWTCKLTPAEWAERLLGYDYVFLGRVDSQFWVDYGALFQKPRATVLYSIVKSGPNLTQVELVPLAR